MLLFTITLDKLVMLYKQIYLNPHTCFDKFVTTFFEGHLVEEVQTKCSFYLASHTNIFALLKFPKPKDMPFEYSVFLRQDSELLSYISYRNAPCDKR